jgi:transposase-like protein
VAENDPIQRWTAKRRTALVISILKGETSAKEAARKHGLTLAEVESWVERGLAGMENQLRSRPKDEEAFKDERIKQLERKVGQMALDNDILREAGKLIRPTEGRTSEE